MTTAGVIANHKMSAIARFVRNADHLTPRGENGPRDQVTLPNNLLNDLDYAEDARKARTFQVKSLYDQKLIDTTKRLLEASLPAASDRRRYELKLADMIQHRVIPFYAQFEPQLKELPAKLRACRDSGLVGIVAETGEVRHRWPEKCNQGKLCAHEAREEGQRLADRYLQPISNFLSDHRTARLQYWVISPLNCQPETLHDSKREILKVFSKLNRRAVTKRVAGAVVVQEDPLSADNETWNLHINVLALVNGYFDWKAYRQAFMDELGHDQIQIEFISQKQMERRSAAKAARRAKRAGGPVSTMPPNRHQVIADTFVELIKYVTKITGYDHVQKTEPEGVSDQGSPGPDDTGDSSRRRIEARPMYAWPADRWFEWYRANKGFRRTRSYGVLYRVCDTCGSYQHSAAECGQQCEPEPVVEWVGSVEWRDFAAGYVSSIDLIPAHKSAIHADDWVYVPSFDRDKRGSPG